MTPEKKSENKKSSKPEKSAHSKKPHSAAAPKEAPVKTSRAYSPEHSASKETSAVENSVASATPAIPVMEDTRNALQKRRVIQGVVVSDKMQKTIVVKVDRRIRDYRYKKYILRSRRFKAHDEKNEAKIGDLVSLVESRPLSRDKRWVLQEILRRSGQTPDANV